MERFCNCQIAISPKERGEAKRLAKSKGMTFQGWLGQLVKREIYNSRSSSSSAPGSYLLRGSGEDGDFYIGDKK